MKLDYSYYKIQNIEQFQQHHLYGFTSIYNILLYIINIIILLFICYSRQRRERYPGWHLGQTKRIYISSVFGTKSLCFIITFRVST